MEEPKKMTELVVEGMTCPSCARHVTTALQAVEGVEAVEVRVRERKVSVTATSEATLRDLVEALRGAGYEARAA